MVYLFRVADWLVSIAISIFKSSHWRTPRRYEIHSILRAILNQSRDSGRIGGDVRHRDFLVRWPRSECELRETQTRDDASEKSSFPLGIISDLHRLFLIPLRSHITASEATIEADFSVVVQLWPAGKPSIINFHSGGAPRIVERNRQLGGDRTGL
jgi:hypothetical protein